LARGPLSFWLAVHHLGQAQTLLLGPVSANSNTPYIEQASHARQMGKPNGHTAIDYSTGLPTEQEKVNQVTATL
jgi:hypothetical protein